MERSPQQPIPKAKPVLAQLQSSSHASLPDTLREPELCGLLILFGSFFSWGGFVWDYFGVLDFFRCTLYVLIFSLMWQHPQEIKKKHMSAFNGGCDKCNSEVAIYSSFPRLG